MSKLTQEETKNLNRLITSKEIESVTKKLLTKKSLSMELRMEIC